MRKMRFSIAGLMGLVVVAALGIGGLKNADETWASGCFTLLVVGLVLAILHAVQGRGRDRAFWVGFAVAGWAYFAVVFGPIGPSDDVGSPSILTRSLFDQLERVIHPGAKNFTVAFTGAVTGTPTVLASPGVAAPPAPTSGFSSIGFVKAASPPSLAIPPTAPSAVFSFLTPPPANLTRVYYIQVAHSLTAMLAGLLGGLYSFWLFASRERRGA